MSADSMNAVASDGATAPTDSPRRTRMQQFQLNLTNSQGALQVQDWKICLKSTFLDIASPFPSDGASMGRRSSCPSPSSPWRDDDIWQNQEQEEDYVKELGEKFEQGCPEITTPILSRNTSAAFNQESLSRNVSATFPGIDGAWAGPTMEPILSMMEPTLSMIEPTVSQVGPHMTTYDIIDEFEGVPPPLEAPPNLPIPPGAGAPTASSSNIVINGEASEANRAVANSILRSKVGDWAANCPLGADAQARQVPSAGSHGHPHLCHHPCRYFAEGACPAGQACGFCHLPHDRRSAHLDKKNRESIRALEKRIRVAMLAAVMIEKVDDLNLGFEAGPLVDAWGKTIGCPDFEGLTEGELGIKRSDQKRLLVCLRSLHFNVLLGLLTKSAEDPVITDANDTLLQSLRTLAINAGH